MRKTKIYTFITAILFIFWGISFAQDVAQEETSATAAEEKTNPQKQIPAPEPLTIESIKQAFQEAIQELDAGKKQEEEKLAAELKDNIKITACEWISAAEKGRESELDKLAHSEWNDLGKVRQPIQFPIPTDYHLRNYAYILRKSDVFKTESMIAVYKGTIEITENLYIEMVHSANATSIDPYLYTATRTIAIDAEYAGDKFNISDVAYGNVLLQQGWPQEIKKKNP